MRVLSSRSPASRVRPARSPAPLASARAAKADSTDASAAASSANGTAISVDTTAAVSGPSASAPSASAPSASAHSASVAAPKELHIGGYRVLFPHTPYPPQLQLMAKMISALDASLSPYPRPHPAEEQGEEQAEHGDECVEDCAKEGQGQSQCKGQQQQPGQKQGKTAQNVPAARFPRIFYASRTHSQISQVVRELRKCSYSPSMTVLASRKHYCCNNTALKKPSVDEACKSLLSPSLAQGTDESQQVAGTGCIFFRNYSDLMRHASLQPGGPLAVHDVEDLVKLGRQTKGCPYFAARAALEEVDVVMCPYNYVLSPVVRRSMDIRLDGSILIFDEAHNIEDVSREAASFEANVTEFQELAQELELLARPPNPVRLPRMLRQMAAAATAAGTAGGGEDGEEDLEGEDSMPTCTDAYTRVYAPLADAITALSEWLNQQCQQLIERQKHKGGRRAGSKTPFHSSNPSDDAVILAGDQILTSLSLAGFPLAHFPLLLQCSNKAMFLARSEKAVGFQVSAKGAALLDGLFVALSFILSDGCRALPDYRMLVHAPTAASPSAASDSGSSTTLMASSSSAAGREGQQQQGQWRFSLWCLNPAVAFRPVAAACRSIVLTSGTLSPTDSFASELGIDFTCTMEGMHVVDSNTQVWAGVIPRGPSGLSLNASYANACTPAFQDELAEALLPILAATPAGVLLFLPSFWLLDALCTRWKATGAWHRLSAVKKIFMEPRGGEKLEGVLARYRREVQQSALKPWTPLSVPHAAPAAAALPAQPSAAVAAADSPEAEAAAAAAAAAALGVADSAGAIGVGKRVDDRTKGMGMRWRAVGGGGRGKSGSNGAMLMAVCRGKASEGIDFADDTARAVMVVGIPFPNIKCLQVTLKKAYNNQAAAQPPPPASPHLLQYGEGSRQHQQQQQQCVQRLNGDQWYRQNAFRALNQAIGRCIRHRFDYGAIILLDDRLLSPHLQQQMPRWLRSQLCAHASPAAASTALSSFFTQAKFRAPKKIKGVPEGREEDEKDEGRVDEKVKKQVKRDGEEEEDEDGDDKGDKNQEWKGAKRIRRKQRNQNQKLKEKQMQRRQQKKAKPQEEEEEEQKRQEQLGCSVEKGLGREKGEVTASGDARASGRMDSNCQCCDQTEEEGGGAKALAGCCADAPCAPLACFKTTAVASGGGSGSGSGICSGSGGGRGIGVAQSQPPDFHAFRCVLPIHPKPNPRGQEQSKSAAATATPPPPPPPVPSPLSAAAGAPSPAALPAAAAAAPPPPPPPALAPSPSPAAARGARSYFLPRALPPLPHPPVHHQQATQQQKQQPALHTLPPLPPQPFLSHSLPLQPTPPASHVSSPPPHPSSHYSPHNIYHTPTTLLPAASSLPPHPSLPLPSHPTQPHSLSPSPQPSSSCSSHPSQPSSRPSQPSSSHPSQPFSPHPTASPTPRPSQPLSTHPSQLPSSRRRSPILSHRRAAMRARLESFLGEEGDEGQCGEEAACGTDRVLEGCRELCSAVGTALGTAVEKERFCGEDEECKENKENKGERSGREGNWWEEEEKTDVDGCGNDREGMARGDGDSMMVQGGGGEEGGAVVVGRKEAHGRHNTPQRPVETISEGRTGRCGEIEAETEAREAREVREVREVRAMLETAGMRWVTREEEGVEIQTGGIVSGEVERRRHKEERRSGGDNDADDGGMDTIRRVLGFDDVEQMVMACADGEGMVRACEGNGTVVLACEKNDNPCHKHLDKDRSLEDGRCREVNGPMGRDSVGRTELVCGGDEEEGGREGNGQGRASAAPVACQSCSPQILHLEHQQQAQQHHQQQQQHQLQPLQHQSHHHHHHYQQHHHHHHHHQQQLVAVCRACHGALLVCPPNLAFTSSDLAGLLSSSSITRASPLAHRTPSALSHSNTCRTPSTPSLTTRATTGSPLHPLTAIQSPPRMPAALFQAPCPPCTQSPAAPAAAGASALHPPPAPPAPLPRPVRLQGKPALWALCHGVGRALGHEAEKAEREVEVRAVAVFVVGDGGRLLREQKDGTSVKQQEQHQQQQQQQQIYSRQSESEQQLWNPPGTSFFTVSGGQWQPTDGCVYAALQCRACEEARNAAAAAAAAAAGDVGCQGEHGPVVGVHVLAADAHSTALIDKILLFPVRVLWKTIL
ncbi:hypothetical protein CLOM_g24025 [Closterium sp. NIES-68]|nr:hypothetical protein CLOM_g24025 [Closterium sp. NIES-68]